jgi:hypothetical protein
MLDDATHPWPDLPLDAWRPTYRSLHMWSQVVGKTLLAHAAPQNHFWHCALRVSGRGLASAAPLRQGDRCIDVEFDLVDHALVLRSGDGRTERLPLAPRSVHAFHDEYLGLLRSLGLETHVWTTPVEVPDPVPFDRDDAPGAYDAQAANRFWQVLRRCDAALRDLSNGYLGKQSPVQFFWGSFDLASTRFSGRRAPPRPGADPVTREAYSHEVISFGFWPGGVSATGVALDEPVLYGYAAPEPAGFRDARLRPAAARYDARLGEFVLPWSAVRTAPDPAADIRAFCEAVYVAGATLGGWDRDALERGRQGEARPGP